MTFKIKRETSHLFSQAPALFAKTLFQMSLNSLPNAATQLFNISPLIMPSLYHRKPQTDPQ